MRHVTYSKSRYSNYNWHDWFAWWPVRIEQHTVSDSPVDIYVWVWWEVVQRKRVDDHDCDGVATWRYDYRLKEPKLG